MIDIVACPYRPLEQALPARAPYCLLKTGRCSLRDRWSLVGWDPWCAWTPAGHVDPLGDLDDFLSQIRRILPPWQAPVEGMPVALLMGALSYDLGRTIETVPDLEPDPWAGLQAVLFGFRQCLIADEVTQRCWQLTVDVPSLPFTLPAAPQFPCPATQGSNFTPAAYMTAVEAIRARIAAGECYQVNLSQQFCAPAFDTAATYFRRAVECNPAPMMALLDVGPFQIISTSPETLIQRQGDTILSRPIKGTRPRRDDPSADARERAALLASAKDRAELAMIIDLVRNDLGRVARADTVRVLEADAVESYANVHHLVATVQAQLRPDVSWGTLLRAIFPGGSVTGCPKAQAMRVIEELEPVRRGFYCGSLGYIGHDDHGTWNIAIRTITMHHGVAVFNLGGAVVFDSDSRVEYQETLEKGQTLFTLMRHP